MPPIRVARLSKAPGGRVASGSSLSWLGRRLGRDHPEHLPAEHHLRGDRQVAGLARLDFLAGGQADRDRLAAVPDPEPAFVQRLEREVMPGDGVLGQRGDHQPPAVGLESLAVRAGLAPILPADLDPLRVIADEDRSSCPRRSLGAGTPLSWQATSGRTASPSHVVVDDCNAIAGKVADFPRRTWRHSGDPASRSSDPVAGIAVAIAAVLIPRRRNGRGPPR